MTMADLDKYARQEWQKKVKRLQWGPWKFNKRNYTLTHLDEVYEIDLEPIKSSAEILDWIFQIESKAWATPECIGYLVLALGDLLHPQAFYCSRGKDHKCPAKQAIDTFLNKYEE